MFSDLKPYADGVGNRPEGWTLRRLGSLGAIFKGNGGSKADDVPSGQPVVRYGELYSRFRTVVATPASFVSAEAASRYTALRRGDVVFAASGESVEDIGTCVAVLLDGARCGGDTVILRPMPGLDPVFLALALGTPEARRQKTVGSTGTMIVHIGAGALKTVSLQIPPLDEQAVIVTYLAHAHRRINRAIMAKRKSAALFREFLSSVRDQAFSGLESNAEPMLGRVLERIEQGWSPSAAEGVIGEDQWTVLSLSAINDGTFVPSARKPIPCGLTVPEGLELRDGDVLMSRSNTRSRVGDAAVVVDSLPRCIPSDLIYRLTPSERLDPKFLVQFLRSRRGRALIESDARGSSETMPKISQSHIRAWRIPVPSVEEQREIVARLEVETERVDRQIGLVQREIALLEEFKTRLTSDVVTGQVDVRSIAATLPPIDPAEAFAAPSDAPDTAVDDDEPLV